MDKWYSGTFIFVGHLKPGDFINVDRQMTTVEITGSADCSGHKVKLPRMEDLESEKHLTVLVAIS